MTTHARRPAAGLAGRPVDPSVAWYARHPQAPAPRGHLFASACWLVARHGVLHQLACRVPGVVDEDRDVLPWVLADAFADLDEHVRQWAAYEAVHRPPTGYGPADEARYEAWLTAGPQPTDAARALAVMSRTEVARLRLVAAFSDDQPVAFMVGMLDGFDDAGHDLITDWLTAVHAYRSNAQDAAGDTQVGPWEEVQR